MSNSLMDPRPVDSSHSSAREANGPGASHAAGKSLELQAQDAANRAPGADDADDTEETRHLKPWDDTQRLLQKFRAAESQAMTYIEGHVRARWQRSIKAYHNQHFDGSKYKSTQFKGRSKIFRPKTRSAVRKQMTAAAEALFSGKDVVSVTAQDETNNEQQASAAIKQELLNYRLDRSNRRNGIPWFLTAMGARQNASLTGICASKQSWKYVEEPALDERGEEIIGEDGYPQMILRMDRPDIELIPPENILLSPACNWVDPVGSSEYMIIRYNMQISDILDLVGSSQFSNSPLQFHDLDEDDIRRMRGQKQGPSDTIGPRSARHGGADPVQQTPDEFPTIWVHECFMKVGGKDVVFWTLGTTHLISNAAMVAQVYPAFAGNRPVVLGVGEVEPHVVYPMASAESWQQMQQELNDNVNLRLDHFKQVVSPLAKVKRGRQVDMKQVQSRGSNNGVVLLENPQEDLIYEQIPDVPQSAYAENNYLNNDFDDLAGTFNAGSVQSNRQLNETVGGMKLLAGSANAVGTFDLTVWVETWVEPVMWQLLKLEEYYESDPVILGLCGARGKLIERHGINEITDTLLQAETNLKVKVGVGVTNDPMERLQKFGMAADIVGKVLAPYVQMGAIKPPPLNQKEVIDEVFGAAGFNNASERFFSNVPERPEDEPQQGQEGPPPEVQAKMAELQAKQQGEMQKLQADMQKATMEHEREMARMVQEREQFQQQIEQQRYATDTQATTSDRDRIAQIGMHEDKTLADIMKAIATLSAGERNAERQAKAKEQQSKQRVAGQGSGE